MPLIPRQPDFERLFIEPRFSRRAVLALCQPPVAPKNLKNWTVRGLIRRLGVGQAEDLRAQAAAAEANKRRRPRLRSGWEVLQAMVLNQLSWHAVPLGLVHEIAPIGLHMARTRFDAEAGDAMARWALAAVPQVVTMTRAPTGEWSVDVLMPDAPRPYLAVHLDLGRIVEDLLVALTAEPRKRRPAPRPTAEV